jgi:hypothetical protein
MRISQTEIESFIRCPRCAVRSVKHRVPKSPLAPFAPFCEDLREIFRQFYAFQDGSVLRVPFTLSDAVGGLLKSEFDAYRQRGVPHPLMAEAGIEAVPFRHPELERWRDAPRRGIEHELPELGVTVEGGVDDVWRSRDGSLHVVDCKATPEDGRVSLDAERQKEYRRRVEINQWLLRRNGFQVSDTAYLVRTTAGRELVGCADRLLFSTVIVTQVGDDSWVRGAIEELVSALGSPTPPGPGNDCDVCHFTRKFCGPFPGARQTSKYADIVAKMDRPREF